MSCAQQQAPDPRRTTCGHTVNSGCLSLSLSLTQLDGNTDGKTGTKVCWRYLNKIQCRYIRCCVCGCYCCCSENSLSWKIQNPAVCLLRASIFSTANQPLGRTLFQTGAPSRSAQGKPEASEKKCHRNLIFLTPARLKYK